MKIKKNIFFAVFCSLLLFLVSFIVVFAENEEDDGTGASYSTYISNDVILFTSHDKYATNDNVPHYATQGFVITRCRRGNAKNDAEKEPLVVDDEWIWFLLDHYDGRELILEERVDNGDGTSNTQWKMSFEVFKERVKDAGYDEWYADLNDKNATEDLHILMDAIMYTKVKYRRINELTGDVEPAMLQPEALIEFNPDTGEPYIKRYKKYNYRG